MPATLTAPVAQPGENTNKLSAEEELSSDFETFLKMMTVQMQNQDPLNPMESTEFAMQLATFSGVEQQVRSNSLLDGMSTKLDLMGLNDLAGWVGMEARVVSSAKFDGTPITLKGSPPTTADATHLVVKNGDGTIVQKTQVPVSSEQVSWAGVAESGTPFPSDTYTFELESWSEGKLLETSQMEVYTRIVETRKEDGSLKLVTESGHTVGANDVSALREASKG
ncbi:flagellar hook assembly protein FlgD [Aliiroseovarius sp. KMU-50]|uniref:Basal-body rod modification protein FlgD n=1 Tax=Aliiroseovarius salicola TaxID=3009082 RepID=A0ABT4W3K4_9RHOB|nr:flagellar hook capping FlgD N-terminal domain-containing protein [Aliiroseovarius sp. KMU-50]MDA5095108.1 flagellar hook assembly protein FlgD [Aliiroseovarius sp. KMU-50]